MDASRQLFVAASNYDGPSFGFASWLQLRAVFLMVQLLLAHSSRAGWTM